MIPTDIKQELINITNDYLQKSVNSEWNTIQENLETWLTRAAKQGESFTDIHVTHGTNRDKLVKMLVAINLTATVLGTRPGEQKVRVSWEK